MSKDDSHNWSAQTAAILGGRRPVTQSRGSVILEIAERLRPWLMKMFEGVRDPHGNIMQPAHIRGIALNLAQRIIKEEENQSGASA